MTIRSLAISVIFLCFSYVSSMAQTPVVASAPTVAAMQVLSTSAFQSGITTVSVQGYYEPGTGAGQWVWNNTSCSVTWCVSAISPGIGSYTYAGGPIIDPLALGAYENVKVLYGVVSNNSTCTYNIPSPGIPASDAGKQIVITIANNGVASTPTYYGTIVSATPGSSATVVVSSSPVACPSFSGTTQSQTIYWGTDDSTAWNTAIAYAGSLSTLEAF